MDRTEYNVNERHRSYRNTPSVDQLVFPLHPSIGSHLKFKFISFLSIDSLFTVGTQTNK